MHSRGVTLKFKMYKSSPSTHLYLGVGGTLKYAKTRYPTLEQCAKAYDINLKMKG